MDKLRIALGGWPATLPNPSTWALRDRERLNGEKKEVGRATVHRVHGFPWTESLPGKESFFLLSSALA